MDVELLTQLIGSLGFPIVACIYMAVTQQKSEERHSKEVDELRKAVNNNTNVMVKLCTKLGVDIDIKEE
jgi:ATP-dependent RNA circularization protein (DNA/RNA ligase family)